MPDDPQIVQVDLGVATVVVPAGPLPIIANETILAYCKANISPDNEGWEWNEEDDSYNCEGLISINSRMFKNSKLQDHDASRYQKLLVKRRNKQ